MFLRYFGVVMKQAHANRSMQLHNQSLREEPVPTTNGNYKMKNHKKIISIIDTDQL
jgi:hypothetical protein